MIEQGVISTTELLARLRSLAAEAEGTAGRPAVGAGTADFSTVLKASLDRVNEAQQNAARLGDAFEMGDPNASVADVMVAIQKSNLSFQAAAQVRNKLVAAYQEIMSMQI
jgi:flagellar hook-basal body complex protein FliE